MIGYFEKKIVEDVLIERVNLGRVTLIEAKVFWERLQMDIVQGHKKIIADLSDCELVDSTFIGVIVQAQRILLKNQGKLKLVLPVNQRVEFFNLVGVSRIITVYELLEDAVNSFNHKSKIKKMAVA
jgi:anti-anti-sigma regulatory factor